MKELQAGIQLVRAKVVQLKHQPVMDQKPLKALPQQVGNLHQQRPLLPFPVRSSLGGLRQRTRQGLKRLESQAERINQLSAELEAAVFELKAIASEINSDWKAIQATQNSSIGANICEYRAVVVPHVAPKQDGSFVLLSKPIDLFQAEREATLLAQTLRNRAKNKRGHRSRKR